MQRADVQIDRADPRHAAFLAQVILQASRAHLSRGPFDLILGLSDPVLLAILHDVVLARRLSNCHISKFLVAELDGRPVGALAGFDPAECDLEPLGTVLMDVCRQRHDMPLATSRIPYQVAALEGCFAVSPPGTWTIEWVGVARESQRRGVCGCLMGAILREGERRGLRTAQVSTYSTNLAARAAYERAGFRTVREVHDPLCTLQLGTPGIMTLRRAMP